MRFPDCLADQGGTRGKRVEDTSSAHLAPEDSASVSSGVGLPEASDPGRICHGYRIRIQICPMAPEACRRGLRSTNSTSSAFFSLYRYKEGRFYGSLTMVDEGRVFQQKNCSKSYGYGRTIN